MTTSRRDFLKTAALAGAGAGLLAGCSKPAPDSAPAINTNTTFKWTMATSWPPGAAVMGEAAKALADRVKAMSNGRLEIVVKGAGEMFGPLEVHTNVASGEVQMGHGASYYWAGLVPAANWFTGIPFGMTAQQINAWLLNGGGLELWNEAYAESGEGVVAFPAGNTGCQMGGWFNKEINTPDDIKHLTIRMPGLGGQVMSLAGATVQLMGGGEIYTSLDLGRIDAAEWVGPFHDYQMGLHKIAKYYYYPGWQEPGSVLELSVHKPSWDRLPADLQAIVRAAALQGNAEVLNVFESRNYSYLQKIRLERGDKVQLKRFSDEILTHLRSLSAQVVDDITAKDPMAKKTHDSFTRFQKDILGWSDVGEYPTLAMHLGGKA